MIQILLHGLKMDPLVSLHYYAPVCALINLAILPFTEGMAPFLEIQKLGYVIISFEWTSIADYFLIARGFF